MLDGLVPRADDRLCLVIARSTTGWRARSVGNWLCRRQQARAEVARIAVGPQSSIQATAIHW